MVQYCFDTGPLLVGSAPWPPTATEVRRLAAIMFTDMVGYSALVERKRDASLGTARSTSAAAAYALPAF